MGSRWEPEQIIVDRLSALVRAGSSVRAATHAVRLPLSMAYRMAHQLNLPMRRTSLTACDDQEEVRRLWRAGWAPMDIARRVQIGSSVVYRIGIELGLWHRHSHGRTAKATTRRCTYLQLRIHALGRTDAAVACGINPRDALDYDKGVIKRGRQRVAFVPDGPGVALYNRLMQLLPYADGRASVPVQNVAQGRID